MGNLLYGFIVCIVPIVIMNILLQAMIHPSKDSKNIKNNQTKKDTVRVSASALEDRKGDWLANQLYAERLAKQNISEMFSLKLEHEDNCAAKENRDFHQSHCDANKIDTGINK